MPRDVDFNYTASDKTGSAAGSAQRNIRKTGDAVKSEASKIENIFGKGLVSIVEGVSPKLASTLVQAFSSAGEVAGPVLAGVVIAAAPLIGATISAAIIGGAGLGGVVGGVLLAAQDARVQAAFAGMKTRIGNQLKSAAIPFISQTIGGIGDIEAALNGINFKSIFAKSATFVRPLTQAVGSALTSIGDGVEKLIAGAGPVIGSISNGIRGIGQTIGGIFDSLADNGVEAAVALNVAFGSIIITLQIAGTLINALTESFGFLAKFGVFGAEIQQEYFAAKAAQDIAAKSAKDGTDPINTFVDAMKDAGAAASDSAPGVKSFAQAVDDVAAAGIGFYESQTNVAASLKTLDDGLKKNGKSLDENTEKGRNNRTNLAAYAQSLISNYDGYVKLNGAGKGANDVLATSRDRFIAAAEKAGKTRVEAGKLATQFGLLPSAKDMHINTNADDAKEAINRAHTAANNLPSQVSIDIAVHTNIESVKRKVANTLSRLGANFDATGGFSFAAEGATSRTERARPVQVDSTVTVLLDSKPFQAIAVTAANEAVDRATHRQKVGKR